MFYSCFKIRSVVLLTLEAEELGKLGADRAALRLTLQLLKRVLVRTLVPPARCVFVGDGVQRVQRLVLLHEPLDLIDQVLGALAVHVPLVVVVEQLVDPLLLLAMLAPFVDSLLLRVHSQLVLPLVVMLLRRPLVIILRQLLELLLERYLLLRIDLQFEFSVLCLRSFMRRGCFPPRGCLMKLLTRLLN